MVSNSTLATLCVRSGIYELVDVRAHRLGDALRRFAKEVNAKHQEEHILAAKDKRPPGQYWLDIECSKVRVQYVLLAPFVEAA
jgi:endoribonuclease Dicer